MNNPIAVIISDVHYSVNTLDLADAAMNMAIEKANDLEVPLIVSGDLHDTKANMRAECVNAMLKTFKKAASKPLVLVGNHDRINEKNEEHSLNFLNDVANLINKEAVVELQGKIIDIVNYNHDVEALRSYLKKLPAGSFLIMHQGLLNSEAGEYIQDHSALSHDDVKDFKVISGHYHKRQHLKTGPSGYWNYVGNPYTLNFGEAYDPEKGFLILCEDEGLEFVPTKLRKHVVIKYDLETKEAEWSSGPTYSKDLIWLKVSGPNSKLKKLDKEKLCSDIGILRNCRFDLIPTDKQSSVSIDASVTKEKFLDKVIDAEPLDQEKKEHLKKLWRNL
jgi:DNA repair exonuclease SbcCD nuclease subunit